MLLTDVDGFYASNGTRPRLVRTIRQLTPEMEALCNGHGKLGRGGMRSKLRAAKTASDAGVKRVLYVGGASSLEVAPGKALADLPDFPEIYREEAREGREALGIWRNEAKGLDWTYLSPAAEIAPGKRTGKYRTTDDKLLVDDKGKSFITFEDYAAAVLDELESPKHIAKRFGVAY